MAVDKRRSGSEETILRSIHYPLHLISSRALSLDTNGSVAVFDIKDAPLHIPNQATEVYAKLLFASIPYDWSIPQEEALSDTIPTNATFSVEYIRASSLQGNITSVTVTAAFSDNTTRTGTFQKPTGDLTTHQSVPDFMDVMKRYTNEAARLALPYEEDLFDVHARAARLYLAKQPSLHDKSTTGSVSATIPNDVNFDITIKKATSFRARFNSVTVTAAFSDNTTRTGTSSRPSAESAVFTTLQHFMETMKRYANDAARRALPYEEDLFDINALGSRLYLAKQPSLHDTTGSTLSTLKVSFADIDAISYGTDSETRAWPSQTTVYDSSNAYQTDFVHFNLPATRSYDYTLTLKAGDYRNPEDLQAALNAPLTAAAANSLDSIFPLLRVRAFDDLQKWQLGAVATQDLFTHFRVPQNVTFTTANNSLKNLLGWATGVTNVTLHGTDKEPTEVYDPETFNNANYRTSSAYVTAQVTTRTLSTLKVLFNASGNILYGDGLSSQAWPSETTVYDSSNEFQTDFVPFNIPHTSTFTKSNLTLRAGNYRSPSELEAALNATLQASAFSTLSDGAPATLRVRSFDGLQKWQLGALLTNDLDTYPRQTASSVKFSTTDSNLKALLGWKTTTNHINLYAVGKEPTVIYDDLVFTQNGYRTSSAYATVTPADPDPVKALYIETNFTNAGVNTLASPSRTLAMIPITATYGNYIHFAPSIESQVHCGHNLMGDSHTELEFRIVDQDHNPIVFQNPSTKPWTLQVEIDWQEGISKDRTEPSPTETKFR